MQVRDDCSSTRDKRVSGPHGDVGVHSAFHRERYLRRGGTSGAERRALVVDLGGDGTAFQLLDNRLRCEMQKSVDPSVGELEVLRQR